MSLTLETGETRALLTSETHGQCCTGCQDHQDIPGMCQPPTRKDPRAGGQERKKRCNTTANGRMEHELTGRCTREAMCAAPPAKQCMQQGAAQVCTGLRGCSRSLALMNAGSALTVHTGKALRGQNQDSLDFKTLLSRGIKRRLLNRTPGGY